LKCNFPWNSQSSSRSRFSGLRRNSRSTDSCSESPGKSVPSRSTYRGSAGAGDGEGEFGAGGSTRGGWMAGGSSLIAANGRCAHADLTMPLLMPPLHEPLPDAENPPHLAMWRVRRGPRFSALRSTSRLSSVPVPPLQPEGCRSSPLLRSASISPLKELAVPPRAQAKNRACRFAAIDLAHP